MKQLEELERKVLAVVQKNKELHDENELLKADNEELRNKVDQLESSLMNQNKSSEKLEDEKTAIKTSIEDLLDSLSSLETTSEETIK